MATLAALAVCGAASAAAAQDLKALTKRAESGDPSAQNDLGTQLTAAKSKARQRQGRAWLKRAMDGGDIEAKNNYAVALRFGIGGPADTKEARRLQEEAATQGSEGANLTLADYYLAGGEGYAKDAAKAHALVVAAANSPVPSTMKHCYAQWRAGIMTLEGTGTPKDPAAAYGWIKRSADNGCVNGMISQAVMLATGDGVAEDDVAARTLYTQAAHSRQIGFDHALRGLAGMMLIGEGGPADLPRGCAYLLIASAAGDPLAPQMLDHFAAHFTPQVQDECKRISTQWSREYLSR